jgi:hypothetical protein
MNLLSKLFSKNGKHDASEQIISDPVRNNLEDGFKQAFVDENPPVSEFEMKKENILRIFMEQNFFSKGYNDGYEYHSKQNLDSGIATIRSEYQHLVDIILDDKKKEIYLLKHHKIENEGMPGNIIELFDLKIDEYSEFISKCQKEYDLAEYNKGHVEFPINKYTEGFERGQKQYFNEKFFAESTGLFI